MSVSALGYVVARTKDLSDWGSFGPGLLGLQRVDKSPHVARVPHGRPQAAHHRRCPRR